jgi:hypothetical protein
MIKFNWGWGVLLACLSFIGFMSTLVYKACQQDVDFVTTNYYEKELKFQQEIDKMKNASDLPENISIVQDDPQHILIRYPQFIDRNKIEGRITFFRPDNADLDFEVAAQCDESNQQRINATAMKSGAWRVKINWSADGKPYYYEEKIFVN